MERRIFLKTALAGGASLALGRLGPWTDELSAQEVDPAPKALRIWDAHAHPQSLFNDYPDPTTPTITMMKQIGVQVCVFAAVADLVLNDRRRPDELGTIVAIEGGDALEGRLENLDYFYEEYSVRLITLLHDTNNAIGRHQRTVPSEEGLTSFGRSLVERMNLLGMIIDVAQAQTKTLHDITALTTKPVVDSHTGVSPEKIPFSRLRSWEEMEWVAGTDGLIGTWPLSSRNRNTLVDWAKEIIAIKSRVGMSHVGLGTDGGGRLPKTVEGYKNITDIGKLSRTMREAGLDQVDIRAFLGGNFERVARIVLK